MSDRFDWFAEDLETPMPRAIADKAACARTTTPDVFFPAKGESPKPAKAMCGGCEVREQCLGWLMSMPGERPGIWGGLTASERRKLRGWKERAA